MYSVKSGSCYNLTMTVQYKHIIKWFLYERIIVLIKSKITLLHTVHIYSQQYHMIETHSFLLLLLLLLLCQITQGFLLSILSFIILEMNTQEKLIHCLTKFMTIHP
jgi:hypothetical protein